MNLAGRLYAADVAHEAAKNEVETLLYALFPGWASWRLIKPYGVEVFGSFESTVAATRLMSQGFETVILHDHLATEKVINCRCKVYECWKTDE